MTGCLPAGPPPTGHQLLSDRTPMIVHFSPSETEGVPSYVLVTGPASNSVQWYASTYSLAPLYLVSEPSAFGPVGGLASAKLLAERSDWGYGSFPTDSLGRLLGSFYFHSSSGPLFEIERVNLQTGIQEFLGLVPPDSSQPAITLSPGRTRLIAGGYGGFTVYDLDRAGTYFSTSWEEPTFVGEDLYLFLSSSVVSDGIYTWYSDLFRLKAYGQLEKVFPSVLDFSVISTQQGTRLVLGVSEVGLASAPTGSVLLDPQTLQATSLPAVGDLAVRSAGWAPASPDGQWLPVDAGQLAFLNLNTNEIQPAARNWLYWETPVQGEWRPGHNEYWFLADDGTLRIWKPDSGVTSIPAVPAAYSCRTSRLSSFFTPDGNYWFSTRTAEKDDVVKGTVFVGSADAPAGPVYRVNPAGTEPLDYWSLGDGTLLVGDFTTDARHADYFIVDPATGASQAFASPGYVVAVGDTRALAILNWTVESGSGDLTLIDLRTDDQTVLAESVYQAAVDPGTFAAVRPRSDALAPGTRVAYLLRNRIDSPYDGLWVAELP